MTETIENKQMQSDRQIRRNECPEKDKDGNCLTPGVYSDSEPIGGG